MNLTGKQIATIEEVKKRWLLLQEFETSDNYKKMNDLIIEHHTLENDFEYASQQLAMSLGTIPEKADIDTSKLKPGHLSKYFTEKEFTASRTAIAKNIDNSLTQEHRLNAIILLNDFADVIRDYYGKPMVCTSGYRSKALNAVIPGASSTSEHCNGNAIDFTIPGVDLRQIFNDISLGKIKFKDSFDQLIYEYGQWIHLGRRDAPRRQTLKAVQGKGYIEVKTI